MSKKYFDLPSRLERDFAEIDSKIVMNLYDTNKEYAELQQQLSDLQKKHSFIETIIEGEDEIHLSDAEHQILIQYFKLSRRLRDRTYRRHPGIQLWYQNKPCLFVPDQRCPYWLRNSYSVHLGCG